MQYFYLDNTQRQCGPCTLSELQLRAQAGKIPFNTLVAHNPAAQWVELSSLLDSQDVIDMPDSGNMSQKSPDIPSYLSASVLFTILCSIPFGLASIISSRKVEKLIARGDLEGAKAASKRAKIWLISCIILSILTSIGTFIYRVKSR